MKDFMTDFPQTKIYLNGNLLAKVPYGDISVERMLADLSTSAVKRLQAIITAELRKRDLYEK
jgi:hypothetical protein